MIVPNKNSSVLFLFSLFLIISLLGCSELLDRVIVPRNVILSIYRSPKIDQYKINSVALLPMAPDDTTDRGTFFATNHFLNSLKQKFPYVKFEVPLVDSIMTIDSSAVGKIINSIEKLRKLDLKYFFETDLGYAVEENEADAMLIGTINKIINKKGFSSGRGIFKPVDATLTSCQFTYYLISLKDGRVLWKANILGEEGYYLLGQEEKFAPLDYAISNGIDKVIDKIPLTDSKLE
ncbi:MAG: hypothetical protein FIA82_02970 [Melioribacter sp.]|nr:hypothetical protein [Melioribacter sp.]